MQIRVIVGEIVAILVFTLVTTLVSAALIGCGDDRRAAPAATSDTSMVASDTHPAPPAHDAPYP